MKLKLPKYVHAVRKGEQVYHYFRHGKFRVKLQGRPFSTEFMDAYSAAERAYKTNNPAPVSIGLDRLVPGTFNALIMDYYRSAEFLNLKGISQQGNRNMMERIRKLLGTAQIASLRPRHIEKIMADYAAKPDTANRFRRMFKILMRIAIAKGLRADDPTATIKRLKNRSDGYKTWGEEEISRFYATHKEDSRARLAFDLMLFTGQRRADIVRLGRQHLRCGVLSIRQSKTGTVVDIPVHDRLKATLEGLPKENLTFLVTAEGRPFTAAGFGNWIGDCVREAGLRDGLAKGEKGFSSHGLRKAICRRLADAGCDALQIQAITGHKDLKEIMTYVQARDRVKAAQTAIKAIAGYGKD